MSLLLHDRALETDNQDLVRLTLIEAGAAPSLVNALIPDRLPGPDEQYRFHFDMTKCIGCRSCEIACNEQNGNPADVQWRRVGELEGGTYPDTQRSYLSMGCNHCITADCLRGCPVDAYTKDPLTGIVLHSADACIGCQYCVWNCPYSVPQFNPERGVVGKCDMCRGRLLDGREPACVNACPENAISIEIVNKIEWAADFATAESPGLPPAGQTVSTTRITLPENASSWLERVDTGSLRMEHAHPSLIVMTTAMQAAFGTLATLLFSRNTDPIDLTLVLGLVCIALSVSVLHLGRPAFAWRALKMWRRSWLSREVLCFGLFFNAIAVCTAAAWAAQLGLPFAQALVRPLEIASVALGILGTGASAFIYLVKARPAWNLIHTPLDFFLSSALIGIAMGSALHHTAAAIALFLQHFGIHIPHSAAAIHPAAGAAVAVAWCLNQGIKLLRLRTSSNFESRASYNLIRSERLFWVVALFVLCATASAVLLNAPLAWLATVTAIAAVVLGRYLFFVSVVPLSMALTFLGGRHSAGASA